MALYPFAFIAFLLLLWQIAADRQAVHLLPDPLQVARAFVELQQRGVLFRHLELRDNILEELGLAHRI